MILNRKRIRVYKKNPTKGKNKMLIQKQMKIQVHNFNRVKDKNNKKKL